MSIYRHLTTRQLVYAGLLIPLLCTVLIATLQYEAVGDMKNTRDLVRQIRSVQLALGVFRYSLSDAESCQFRYILTRDDANLKLYQDLMGSARRQFADLKKFLVRTDRQNVHLATIGPLLASKEEMTAESFRREQSGDHAGALQLASSMESRQNMLTIESQVEEMQRVEADILFDGQNVYTSKLQRTSALSVASMVLSLACIVVILYLLRRLSSLQSTVTLDAVKELMRFEDGKVTIEEYLSNRRQALAAHGQAQIEAERIVSHLERGRVRETAPSGRSARE